MAGAMPEAMSRCWYSAMPKATMNTMPKVLRDENQNVFCLKRVKIVEINHLFIYNITYKVVF